VLKRLNPSIQLPKLDVVTINELSGEPDSFGFIGTSQINALLNVAVWSNDVGSVFFHQRFPLTLNKTLVRGCHSGRR
jgi:hypothetical protein